jgi:zinc protease
MNRMRRRYFLTLILLIAIPLSAATVNKLTIPPIDYKHRVLGNGLEVYSIEDHSTPTVAIQVWYRVGSKNDPQGRSGFAHLFEHIMFKSTKHMAAENMDRLTEDVGGANNANTGDDYTHYYEVIPSNYLETLLWAEGERLGSLTVDDAAFKSERDVVKEEYRFRVLAPPYGRFYYAIDKDSFAVHPYHRPGIGSIEDLDAATIGDVQAFHSTFYRPDNAVLIVAGDFDPQQMNAWVDKYLGVIANPGTPIPRVTVKEPPRAEAKRFDEHAPNVPLPAVCISWLAPAASNADSDALAIAAAILGRGESSRMYRTMVYRDKISQDVDTDADLREDLGIFYVLTTLASDHGVDEGIKAIMREVEALENAPPSSAEVEKAKNQIITDALRERETNEGKANALGAAIVIEHDAAAANTDLTRLQSVTPADVQRVMKQYIAGSKPNTITYTTAPGSSGRQQTADPAALARSSSSASPAVCCPLSAVSSVGGAK